jgi:putative nucleotidyltransferase with HDIG domain
MGTVRETLLRQLQEIGHLPTLPQVLVQIEDALRSEQSAAVDMAEVIREDPPLTASILRVANSVVYRGRFSGRIASIPQAVARLGTSEVRRICLSTALIRAFDNYGAGIQHEEFWQHSLTVATATRIFQSRAGGGSAARKAEAEDAFVAGLLHDVGMFVMDQFFPELFAKVREHAGALGIPLAKAEEELLGLEHGEIGGVLLRNWGLPARVVDAVAWHHRPDGCPEKHRRVAQMVHLADFICVNQSIGDTLEGVYDGFSVGAWHDLGLSINEAPAMLEDLKEDAVRSEVLGGTVVGSVPDEGDR